MREIRLSGARITTDKRQPDGTVLQVLERNVQVRGGIRFTLLFALHHSHAIDLGSQDRAVPDVEVPQ